MSSFFLLTLLSLTLFYNINADSDLVTHICSQSSTPSLCIKVLRSDPRSEGSDLRGLGQITIDKAQEAALNIIKIAQLLSKGETKGLAAACIRTYGDTINTLNVCKSLLKASDKSSIENLKIKASAAVEDAGYCNDAYVYEGEGEPENLKNASQDTQDLIVVLTVIASEL